MNVILIEDDDIDTMTIKRSISEIGIPINLKVVKNGEEALEYLITTQDQPDLILLDLNMPKMSGLEFMKQFKLKFNNTIPILVLTTSNSSLDRINAYRRGAVGYFLKSLDFNQFKDNLKIILDYWNICQSSS